jgi:hypothetical protein
VEDLVFRLSSLLEFCLTSTEAVSKGENEELGEGGIIVTLGFVSVEVRSWASCACGALRLVTLLLLLELLDGVPEPMDGRRFLSGERLRVVSELARPCVTSLDRKVEGILLDKQKRG